MFKFFKLFFTELLLCSPIVFVIPMLISSIGVLGVAALTAGVFSMGFMLRPSEPERSFKAKIVLFLCAYAACFLFLSGLLFPAPIFPMLITFNPVLQALALSSIFAFISSIFLFSLKIRIQKMTIVIYSAIPDSLNI